MNITKKSSITQHGITGGLVSYHTEFYRNEITKQNKNYLMSPQTHASERKEDNAIIVSQPSEQSKRQIK